MHKLTFLRLFLAKKPRISVHSTAKISLIKASIEGNEMTTLPVTDQVISDLDSAMTE